MDLLENITFNEKAFEHLVLPGAKKRMLTSFVDNAGGAFTDIIKGKGAGCIFLLHGPPGTGKKRYITCDLDAKAPSRQDVNRRSYCGILA